MGKASTLSTVSGRAWEERKAEAASGVASFVERAAVASSASVVDAIEMVKMSSTDAGRTCH